MPEWPFFDRRGGLLGPFSGLPAGSGFDPSSLFAGGEDGVLFERSNANYWQDVTAETVTGATDAIGFALDASQGAGYAGGAFTGLGAELVPNHDFSTASDWTAMPDMTMDISGGAVDWSTTSNNRGPFQVFSYSGGSEYMVLTVEVDGLSGGVLSAVGKTGADGRTGGNVFLHEMSAPGEHVAIAAIGASIGSITPRLNTSGSSSTVSEFSIKEIPGHHATQGTTSFKPTLQAAGPAYDGNDDRLATALMPSTSGSIVARFNGTAASRVIAGSQAAADGRCFLALDASGRLAAGIGAQTTGTIYAGSDIRSGTHIGAVTWNGSTVTLYLDGAEIYSEAQSGAVNTTVAMMVGALNANGTASAFWTGSISDSLIIDRALAASEITNITTAWSE